MRNHSPKPFFKNNIFLLILSIVASLAFLEISLRLTGVICYSARTHSGLYSADKIISDVRDKNVFTIVCLGDSYTYGLGISYDYSYPRQLERMLEKGIKIKFNVQNFGSPGGNSYRILNIFRKIIKEFNIDLAIVMVGMNNGWNLEGTQIFYQSGSIERIKGCVYNLRVYKLWKILTMKLRDKMDKTANVMQKPRVPLSEWKIHEAKIRSFREAGRSDLVIAETEGMLNKYPGVSQLEMESVTYLREMGNYDLALQRAKEMLAYHTDYPYASAYMHLELLYIYRAKRDWGLARQEIDYAIEHIAFIQSVFPELKSICNDESGLDFYKEATSLRKRIDAFHGAKGTRIWDRLMYLEKHKDENLRMLESDLSELINIARKNNVKLIIMTYPVPEASNSTVRKIASRYNIGLIDNELIFSKDRDDKDKLFNLDRHCNAKGYNLIAANIYSVLSKAGFLLLKR